MISASAARLASSKPIFAPSLACAWNLSGAARSPVHGPPGPAAVVDDRARCGLSVARYGEPGGIVVSG